MLFFDFYFILISSSAFLRIISCDDEDTATRYLNNNPESYSKWKKSFEENEKLNSFLAEKYKNFIGGLSELSKSHEMNLKMTDIENLYLSEMDEQVDDALAILDKNWPNLHEEKPKIEEHIKTFTKGSDFNLALITKFGNISAEIKQNGFFDMLQTVALAETYQKFIGKLSDLSKIENNDMTGKIEDIESLKRHEMDERAFESLTVLDNKWESLNDEKQQIKDYIENRMEESEFQLDMVERFCIMTQGIKINGFFKMLQKVAAVEEYERFFGELNELLSSSNVKINGLTKKIINIENLQSISELDKRAFEALEVLDKHWANLTVGKLNSKIEGFIKRFVKQSYLKWNMMMRLDKIAKGDDKKSTIEQNGFFQMLPAVLFDFAKTVQQRATQCMIYENNLDWNFYYDENMKNKCNNDFHINLVLANTYREFIKELNQIVGISPPPETTDQISKIEKLSWDEKDNLVSKSLRVLYYHWRTLKDAVKNKIKDYIKKFMKQLDIKFQMVMRFIRMTNVSGGNQSTIIEDGFFQVLLNVSWAEEYKRFTASLANVSKIVANEMTGKVENISELSQNEMEEHVFKALEVIDQKWEKISDYIYQYMNESSFKYNSIKRLLKIFEDVNRLRMKENPFFKMLQNAVVAFQNGVKMRATQCMAIEDNWGNECEQRSLKMDFDKDMHLNLFLAEVYYKFIKKLKNLSNTAMIYQINDIVKLSRSKKDSLVFEALKDLNNNWNSLIVEQNQIKKYIEKYMKEPGFKREMVKRFARMIYGFDQSTLHTNEFFTWLTNITKETTNQMGIEYLTYINNWDSKCFEGDVTTPMFNRHQTLRNFIADKYKSFVGNLEKLSRISDKEMSKKIENIENMALEEGNRNEMENSVIGAISVLDDYYRINALQAPQNVEGYVKETLEKSGWEKAMILRLARVVRSDITFKDNDYGFLEMLREKAGGIRKLFLPKFSDGYLKFIMSILKLTSLDNLLTNDEAYNQDYKNLLGAVFRTFGMKPPIQSEVKDAIRQLFDFVDTFWKECSEKNKPVNVKVFNEYLEAGEGNTKNDFIRFKNDLVEKDKVTERLEKDGLYKFLESVVSKIDPKES